MSNLKKIFVVIWCVLIFKPIISNAQNTKHISEIKVGERLPNIYITNLHNYKRDKVQLEDLYRNKPLIITFWDVHCNTCLKSLPKLDSIKKKLNDSFNVLSVTENNNAEVQELFKSLPVFKSIHLPYVAGDKILATYFKHRYLPHIVWINKKGIVVAITSEEEITAANIAALIKKGSINLYEKNDDFAFDNEQPYNPPSSIPQFRSVFTNYNPAIRGSEIINARRDSLGIILDSVTRMFLINADAIALLFKPFAALTGLDNYILPLQTRIINKSKIFSFDSLDSETQSINWEKSHLYCYDLITPPLNKKRFFSIMLDDLNRYLPINASIIKADMPCYIIIKKDSLDRLPNTRHRKAVYREEWNDSTQTAFISLQSLSMNTFLNTLNMFIKNEPVFDETHIDYPIDIEINLKLKSSKWLVEYDIESLKKELNKYGLDIVHAKKMIDVLVIQDKKK